MHNGGSHNCQAYPANKPVPRGAFRSWVWVEGKGKVKTRLTSTRAGCCRSVVKKVHHKKARNFQKKLCGRG